MTLSAGDDVPAATLLIPENGDPQPHESKEFFGSGKSVIFGMPGAYTSTCSGIHLPGVVANAEAIRAKGVDRIGVLTTNDPFVMAHWGSESGADDAGVLMIADAEAVFTKALGVEFTFAPKGLIDRSKRYAMVIEDGKITAMNLEENPGVCDVSGGQAVLDILG